MKKVNTLISILSQNRTACLAHVLSFVFVLGMYYLFSNSRRHATAHLYRTSLPTIDQLNSTCNSTGETVSENTAVGKCFTEPAQGLPKKTGVSFNIIYGAASFFAITAFAHAFYASDGFGSGAYTKALIQGWNPYRWIEYGVSASIMSVLIGYVLNTNTLPNLFSYFFLTAGLQAFGYVVDSTIKETNINRNTIIAATIGGWLVFIALWGPMLYQFWSADNDVRNNYKDIIDPDTQKSVRIPSFVWFIIVVQLINFGSFGIIQLLQVRSVLKGVTPNFLDVESRYLKLSFAGKLALASGLAYGLIFRTKGCN
jgi:hypothetical protein